MKMTRLKATKEEAIVNIIVDCFFMSLLYTQKNVGFLI